MNGRLLVFNCHEAWVHQLQLLGKPLDIIVDLPGRHTRGWDTAMRPIPENSRLIQLRHALAATEMYDCIVAHNLTDLLDVKSLRGPRILVIHLTLDGMILEQKSATPAAQFRRAVAEFTAQTRTHVVAVSPLKGNSWGFTRDIVPLSVDLGAYLPWQGTVAAGLRIANFVNRRPQTLLWDFHQQAFSNLPVTLVGHNPEIPGATASKDWASLKSTLAAHRFYIHTADPQLEDGYNTATLEAMAAGLPVLGNSHPTSPIIHGVSGFLSSDPAELRRYAGLLLSDHSLAAKMGQAAREIVTANFSPAAFREKFLRSIASAQKLFHPAKVSHRASAFSSR